MKKVLSLVLVAMMVIGMAPMALAADDVFNPADPSYGVSKTLDVTALTDTFNGDVFILGGYTYDLGEQASPSKTGFAYPLGSFEIYEKNPNAKLTGYYDAGKNYAFTYDGWTRKDIKDRQIAAELRVTNGQKVVDSVEIKYLAKLGTHEFAKNDQPAYIQINFKDFFLSTSDVDYKFKVFLTEKKKHMPGYETFFEGNYKNNETQVDEDDIYVYLGDDVPVVESLAYIKNIDIELDDGLTVHTKFFNNKKYFARGRAKVLDDDDAVLTQYPEIDYVYNIDSMGLNNSYTTVSIDISDKLFVYNSNLEYIGTTNEKLPYSTKYYVSSVELDVEDADLDEPTDDGEEEPGDDFEEDPGMGGDDVPENVNDNPGTGR